MDPPPARGRVPSKNAPAVPKYFPAPFQNQNKATQPAPPSTTSNSTPTSNDSSPTAAADSVRLRRVSVNAANVPPSPTAKVGRSPSVTDNNNSPAAYNPNEGTRGDRRSKMNSGMLREHAEQIKRLTHDPGIIN